MSRGIFRGGLAGGLLAVAFSVLGIIPICGFFAFPLRILAWAVAGYLAGRIAIAQGGGVGWRGRGHGGRGYRGPDGWGCEYFPGASGV